MIKFSALFVVLLSMNAVASSEWQHIEPPPNTWDAYSGREYLEHVCDGSSGVYRHFMYGKGTYFDKYRGYQAVRMKIDAMKDLYPDIQHIAYHCVGGMLILEGQLFGYHILDERYFFENGFKDNWDAVYSDYNQENRRSSERYYQKALQLEQQQPRESWFSLGKLAAVALGENPSREHVELSMRRELEQIKGLNIIGDGTEHPVSKDEYVGGLYYGVARNYAQLGMFDDAGRILDELAQLSEYGAEVVVGMREELKNAESTWEERQAKQAAIVEEIRDRTAHLQPLIWALAESEDGQITPELLASVRATSHSGDSSEIIEETLPSDPVQEVEPKVEKRGLNGEASYMNLIWYSLAALFLLIVAWLVFRRG